MFSVSELLESKGHSLAFFSMEHMENTVSEWNRYFVKHVDYNVRHNLKEQIEILKKTLYSREAEKKLLRLLDDFSPDVAHIHNFNHQLTPSILFALRRKNVPIVMTMHDYKLVCSSYSMLNHGHICELCKGRRFYNCLRTKCHKDSFSKSLLATIESYLHHHILNSYKFIKYFICPSKFIMDKVQDMGLKGKFVHIPNFVDTENLKVAEKQKQPTFVFWGRLSYEKGIHTLVEAMRGLSAKLVIVGDGQIKAEIEKKIKQGNAGNIRLLGYLKDNNLFNKIREAHIAVIPSEWYENNPISILEAFALGIPVIGSRIGGIPELVKDGETGLLFEHGNVKDLRNKIIKLLSEPDKVLQMGKNARALAEKEYNADLHYERLMKVYNDAIAMNRRCPKICLNSMGP